MITLLVCFVVGVVLLLLIPAMLAAMCWAYMVLCEAGRGIERMIGNACSWVWKKLT